MHGLKVLALLQRLNMDHMDRHSVELGKLDCCT